MKYSRIFIIFTLIALTITNRVISQDFDRVFFDENWIVTSADSGVYYRKSGFNPLIPAYHDSVTDFYVVNNQTEMTGYYQNGIRSGIFNFYYPDGKLRLTAEYQENERTGNWKEFYQNGILKISILYEGDIEKLLELNDSKGNSMIKNDEIKYRLAYGNMLVHLSDFENRENEEIMTISGNVINHLRDGRWTIRKGRQLYASLSYIYGDMDEGFVIIDSRKMPLFNKRAFPLIADPLKFNTTERLVLQPGAVIKNNYVTEALHQYRYKSMEKISIKSYDELKEYINDHFTLRSTTNIETVKIILAVSDGKITGIKTEPKLSAGTVEDLRLLIETIEQIEFDLNSPIAIDYIVEYEDAIGKK